MPIAFHYVVVVLIWGTSWLAIKYQLGVVAPEMSIAYRFIAAFAILVGYCLVTGRALRMPRRAFSLVVALGLTLFCANYILFYLAAGYLVTGLLSVVFSTITVMNIINGRLLFGQPVERVVAIGAGLGLVGIGLVFWPDLAGLEWRSGAAWGLLLSLLATYLASLGNMTSVKLGRMGISVVDSNAFGMGVGALGALVYALISGADIVYDLRPAYSISLVFLSLFASVIGFGCYLTLVRRIGAGRAAYATVLFPLIALALSTWFEGYHWPIQAVPGVALVLFGNLLVLSRRSTSPKPEPSPST
jgi:drug/metabolite transporter (DMT)-like permease